MARDRNRHRTRPQRRQQGGNCVGAEPQVLGADKHGPKATLAQPIGERAREVREGVEGAAKDVVGKAKEGVKAGVRKVRTFIKMLTEKQRMEESRKGWRSDAFDL